MTRRSERGSVIVEFALGCALVFTLLTGVCQFGYTFYQYNQLHSAVRNAALYGALRSYDSPSPELTAAYRDAVRNVAVFGAPTVETGSQPAAPDLTPEHIDVRVGFENQVPVAVTVAVQGYAIKGLLRTYTFHNSPRATFRFQGRFTGGFE